MPEFVMNRETREAEWNDLFPITRGFIEALFFTSVASGVYACDWQDAETQNELREGTLDGSIPADAGFQDMDPQSLSAIDSFCRAWAEDHAGLIARAVHCEGYDADRVGNDLYYTRAGHGVGFWDRKELGDELGARLTEAAGRGEVNAEWEGGVEGKVTVDFY